MNIPGGFIEEERSKLPIGVQLVGRPFDEMTLLRIAHVYEEYYCTSEEIIPPLIKNSSIELDFKGKSLVIFGARPSSLMAA